MPHDSSPWTTRRLLSWTTDYFTRKGIDPPRLAAEMLLAHVLGTERIKLYMDADRPASELERSAFRELVERAVRHEPIDYLVGRAPFFSMKLKVTPAVLIPRPSTETAVEHVIDHVRATPGFRQARLADVCTGSGAIAIALAKALPDCQIVATDLHEDALTISGENAREQGVSERIAFRQGDLLTPLAGERFHFLISNPPYISDAEWERVEPNVKDYEPTHALRGGADGLDFVRPLIAHGPDYLLPGGQLVLELAASQKQAALALAGDNPDLQHPRVLNDHEGLPRVLVADKFSC